MERGLEDCLEHEFAGLLTFSRSKFMQESLLFWNAVEAFRRRARLLQGELSRPPSPTNAATPPLSSLGLRTRPSGTAAKLLEKIKTQTPMLAKWLDVSVEERMSLRQQFLANTEVYSSARELDLTMQRNLVVKQQESENQLQLFEMARQLYFTFLDESTSKQWICLPSADMAEIELALSQGRATSELYDDAQRLVFAEMRQTLYPLYLEHKKHQLFPEHFKS
ncbi:hypothetical protein BASA81_004813 [Batrachochytrium salamandrivorans]|nr:hypothetical protein BASA81_004813 [Batrachochytrium salamandrivorans]